MRIMAVFAFDMHAENQGIFGRIVCQLIPIGIMEVGFGELVFDIGSGNISVMADKTILFFCKVIS
jgi:hypothetical protein